MLELFTEGMKIKYGEFCNKEKIIKVNLENLTDNDFKTINNYFKSFGFECFYSKSEINDNDIEYNKLLFQEKYPINNKTKLSDLKFTILNKKFKYIIYFDLYK